MIASAARLTSRAHYGAMKNAPRKETFGERLFACGRKAFRGHVSDIAVHSLLRSGTNPRAGMRAILPFTASHILTQSLAQTCERYCRSPFPPFGREALRGNADNITIHPSLRSGAKPCASLSAIAQSHIYRTQQRFSFCANLRAQICLFTLNMRIMRPYFPNMCLKRTNGRAIIWPYYASLRRLV